MFRSSTGMAKIHRACSRLAGRETPAPVGIFNALIEDAMGMYYDNLPYHQWISQLKGRKPVEKRTPRTHDMAIARLRKEVLACQVHAAESRDALVSAGYMLDAAAASYSAALLNHVKGKVERKGKKARKP